MSKAFGEALDIDRVRARVRNRVYRVGIELEGGWNKLPPGTTLAHDGSVHVERVNPNERLNIGELPSEPLSLDPKDQTYWVPWLKKFYPTHVNATCGMHVHLSFKTALTYQRLMTPQYPATIVAYMSKWAKDEGLPKDHPIWPRLKGKSEFCQHVFAADDQAKMTAKDFNRERNGHRYTVINYCFGRYSTLECRLLPMMQDAAQAERVINELIGVTNAFLLVTAKREEKYGASVVGEGDSLTESRRVIV